MTNTINNTAVEFDQEFEELTAFVNGMIAQREARIAAGLPADKEEATTVRRAPRTQSYRSEKTDRAVRSTELRNSLDAYFDAAHAKFKVIRNGGGLISKPVTRAADIKIGTVLVIKGHVAIVVDITESEFRLSGRNQRVKIIMDNGVESNLLMNTLIKNVNGKNKTTHNASYRPIFVLYNELLADPAMAAAVEKAKSLKEAKSAPVEEVAPAVEEVAAPLNQGDIHTILSAGLAAITADDDADTAVTADDDADTAVTADDDADTAITADTAVTADDDADTAVTADDDADTAITADDDAPAKDSVTYEPTFSDSEIDSEMLVDPLCAMDMRVANEFDRFMAIKSDLEDRAAAMEKVSHNSSIVRHNNYIHNTNAMLNEFYAIEKIDGYRTQAHLDLLTAFNDRRLPL